MTRSNSADSGPVPKDATLDVVIEIPRGSRNKYEFDHETGHIKLDRRLFSATTYPAEYGFVPDTLSEDGDPLDVLVLTEDPTFPGCWIEVRPVGVLWMEDDAGRDAKILCVHPVEPRWAETHDISDVAAATLAEIKHFFTVYKDLEPGKFSIIEEFEGREAAWAEIAASRARYVPSSHGKH
jgi:inorganic pyrophosphatase